jgi:histidinol-phosphate/aromatic aminotransferase/cobyric acid decarboxylase-like protein
VKRRRLRDYYRQFEELSAEEVSRGYRERSAEARSRALSIVPPLDLTSTAWHEPPHAEIVNAATFALRRAVNAYPDPAAPAARAALAGRHGLDADRLVLGHGAGELLAAALAAACAQGGAGQVLLPWPTWPPLPGLARRAGAEPVPVPLHGDAIDLGALDAAIRTETRAIVLASPNDPTGVPVAQADLDGFLRGLPERIAVIVDEACADFLPETDTALPLLAAHPRLIVVRSFAKAHAMAGFRVGWAAGGEGTRELLAQMAPTGAVGAAPQAGVVAALEVADRVLPRRREAAAAARRRLAAGLAGTGVVFPAGAAANFAWLEAAQATGAELAARLAAARIFVTPGTAYGDERRVRAALRGPEAIDRLVAALT